MKKLQNGCEIFVDSIADSQASYDANMYINGITLWNNLLENWKQLSLTFLY